MFEHYFRSPRVRARLRNNPIHEHIERLVEHLHMRGHRTTTIHQYVRAAEHFGRWLSACRSGSLVVTKESVNGFLDRHLLACNCTLPASRSVKTARAALHHMLRIAPSQPGRDGDGADTPAAELVREYVEHLDVNCGLAHATRRYRARYAREFLEAHAPDGASQLRRLEPHAIMRYVADYASRCRRSSTQVAACALRSFLRFLQMRGLCRGTLARAVPWIPRWRHEGLPRYMTDEQHRQFLDSFDHVGATGRRDYAMTLFMSEMGLRVSEVTELHLDDIDWRAGTVRIRSAKERRTRLLPLPIRVGMATASYLHEGRPPSALRHVFLRHRAPLGTPVSRELVRGVVRRAYARSECPHEWTGTHILRHTVATRLLRKGASLKEIADLLGHQSINTSTIYGKVNMPTLAAVAMPWPEVQP